MPWLRRAKVSTRSKAWRHGQVAVLCRDEAAVVSRREPEVKWWHGTTAERRRRNEKYAARGRDSAREGRDEDRATGKVDVLADFKKSCAAKGLGAVDETVGPHRERVPTSNRLSRTTAFAARDVQALLARESARISVPDAVWRAAVPARHSERGLFHVLRRLRDRAKRRLARSRVRPLPGSGR